MLAPAAEPTSTAIAGETTTTETGPGPAEGTEAAPAIAMLISGTTSAPAEEATLLEEATLPGEVTPPTTTEAEKAS